MMVVLRGGVSYMVIYQANVVEIICEDEGVMWIVFCNTTRSIAFSLVQYVL